MLVLVVLPAARRAPGRRPAGGHGGVSVGRRSRVTLAKVAAFVALMLVVGRRVLPRLLWQVARTGSRELFTLAVIAAAVGVAYGSCGAVQRLVRARRVLRRHDAAGVGAEPPGRRGVAAAARRVLGAVLRVGGDAVRSGGRGRRSRLKLAGGASRSSCSARPLAAVALVARPALSAQHRAHGRRRASPRSASSPSSSPAWASSWACCHGEGGASSWPRRSSPSR